MAVALLLILFFTREFISATETKKTWERVKTDLEIIYGNQGVSVNYCYNQTSLDPRQIKSVPGCPKSIDGIPWIYYGNPPRCFLAGTHGPCPLGEKLLAQHGSTYGICACECFVKEVRNFMFIWNPNSEQQSFLRKKYIQCWRKLPQGESGHDSQIFDTFNKICYARYTQGPCKRGELLGGVEVRLDGNDVPICKPQGKEIHGNKFSGMTNCEPDSWWEYNQAGAVARNGCPAGEKYSATLRKCVKEQPFDLP